MSWSPPRVIHCRLTFVLRVLSKDKRRSLGGRGRVGRRHPHRQSVKDGRNSAVRLPARPTDPRRRWEAEYLIEDGRETRRPSSRRDQNYVRRELRSCRGLVVVVWFEDDAGHTNERSTKIFLDIEDRIKYNQIVL